MFDKNNEAKTACCFSICQATELERQRKLLMDGKLEKCPKELANHPVFMVNQATNKVVLQNRTKVNEILSAIQMRTRSNEYTDCV